MNTHLMMSILVSAAMVATAYPVGGGQSNSFRKQDDHGNYAFGYDIVDKLGATNFRKESGDGHGNKVGSYGLHDIDGRLRVVEYVADGHGFRAKIKTNEPGTTNRDAAAAVYNGPDPAGLSYSTIPAGKVPPQPNHIGGYGGPVGYGPVGYGPGYGPAGYGAAGYGPVGYGYGPGPY